MAAFDPGDDAEEMPESKWADGFQRSADAGWWSKGDHVNLGKDLVRSSLRALVPDLPTPSEGDLGLANNMVDGCIPVAFTGIEDKDSGFRLKAGADGTDFTTLEELAAVNGKLIGWLNELATKVSVVKSLTDAGKIQKSESHLVDPSKLARIAKKPVKMTAEQDTAVVAGEALDERALADLIQAHTSLSRAIHTAYHTLIISAPASNTHAIADLPKFFDSEDRLRALWESNLGVKTIRPKQVQDIPELYMLAELLDRRDAYIKYAVESVVGPVPQLINKWVTHLRHIGKHDQTDTSVSFFAHNYRDLMGTELSTQVQSRFRRAELQDMRLVYSQYFKLLAITFPKGFGAAPSASWDKLIVESWQNAVYAAVPKEMISTTLMLSLNYGIDIVSEQFERIQTQSMGQIMDGANDAAGSNPFLSASHSAGGPSSVEVNFSPKIMMLLANLPVEKLSEYGLAKDDGSKHAHFVSCPKFWTAKAAFLAKLLEKIWTFVPGSNVMQHFGGAPSACSFDGEMGKQLVITKGAKFGHGKEGPLTVTYDNEQCINIGTLYDASGAPVETASKKNKREARGKGQEPATVGGGAAVTAPTPQQPPGSVVGAVVNKKPKLAPTQATQLATNKPAQTPVTQPQPVAPTQDPPVPFEPREGTNGIPGLTWDEGVSLERVLFPLGMHTDTTERKAARGAAAGNNDTDMTEYRCLPFDGGGGAQIKIWVPPGGWSQSVKSTKLVCRRDILSIAAKIPAGMSVTNNHQGHDKVAQLTCMYPTKQDASVHLCKFGAHCLHKTLAHPPSGSSGATVKHGAWSDDIKLTAEHWASIAATVPDFIKHYMDKEPAPAAEFTETGGPSAQLP